MADLPQPNPQNVSRAIEFMAIEAARIQNVPASNQGVQIIQMLQQLLQEQQQLRDQVGELRDQWVFPILVWCGKDSQFD